MRITLDGEIQRHESDDLTRSVPTVAVLKRGDNVFRASQSGQGHVSATTPGGSPLYAIQADPETGEPIQTGTIANCVFEEYEWHAVAAYHLDDQTHGPLPGPAGTEVEQVGFIFKNR